LSKNKKTIKMKRTGPDNIHLQMLITELKTVASKENVPLWRRIAEDLERPSRQRRVVNLSRLNRFTKENDVVIVPGKVLASGELDHKLTVSAFTFSDEAIVKMKDAKSDVLTISELLKKNPKAKKVRIIG